MIIFTCTCIFYAFRTELYVLLSNEHVAEENQAGAVLRPDIEYEEVHVYIHCIQSLIQIKMINQKI